MPHSRLQLAIPFVGKDCPSRASEFAHPEVTIGLTVLAYRYSGLREHDVRDVLQTVRSDFDREAGAFRMRRSATLFGSWVREAGGAIKGEQGADDTEETRVIVPLWLLGAFLRAPPKCLQIQALLSLR